MTMTLPAIERTYSIEEFLRLEDSIAFELEGGHLVERNVSEYACRVGARINYLFQIETEVTQDACVYGPDLSYQCFQSHPKRLRRGDVSVIRLSRLEGLDDPGTMPIPADLIVEVLSPNDSAYDVERKIEIYLHAGFKIVWIVNPELKTVHVHRLDGTVTKFHEADEITGGEALPTFRRKVADLFKR